MTEAREDQSIPVEPPTRSSQRARSVSFASLPDAARNRSISVPPLRSMRIRKPPRYNSAADLKTEDKLEDSQASSRPQPRRIASATIQRTIQQLETLLFEAVELARMAVDKEELESPADTRRRPSAGIQERAAAIIGQHVVGAPQSPPNIGLSARKKIACLDRGVLPPREQEHLELPADGLRACDAAHGLKRGNKTSTATAEISSERNGFKLTPLKRRKNSGSKFQEEFEAMPRLQASLRQKNHNDVIFGNVNVSKASLTRRDIKRHVKLHQTPPIVPRTTSVNCRSLEAADVSVKRLLPELRVNGQAQALEIDETDDTGTSDGLKLPRPGHERHFSVIFGLSSREDSIGIPGQARLHNEKIDLRNHRHVDVHQHFEEIDVHETWNHAPVARNWPTSRKRFAAIVACINTACIGVIIGIYGGEVPAIQYVIVDFHHYTILGNSLLYSGLAIPTLLLWPLPLLHGRKPYTVGALTLALCLQIPQGIAVSEFRSPYVRTYRVLLLLSRAVSGFALGFANINLQASLLDLFGASLQSSKPHQEAVDPYDVRRHGGGMGLWLGVWSWCSIGPISVGFLIGTIIISAGNVTWGFWTSLLLLMFVLLINLIAPEIRRAAFRRTIAEIKHPDGGFARVSRGEVKMHLEGTGPLWWGEEVIAGLRMSWLMLKQPGFLVLAVYGGWVYAQFTMILMLLGALASRYYMLRPIQVGLCALALGLGALVATPFQKASWLSRARYRPARTDSMSLRTPFIWTSHLVRRLLFMLLLPVAALGYTLTSRGPPVPVAIPCMFASIVGFSSNLAIAECYGLIMETFDTSDLQAGMIGRPRRRSVTLRFKSQRTNFSCYPRISAGTAVVQSLNFILAAVATGLVGKMERRYGVILATAVVAGALFVLTILLTLALTRWKTVKMIPDGAEMAPPGHSKPDMDWQPVILGNPSGSSRKISLLEAGKQTRWSEIRRRNKVVERV